MMIAALLAAATLAAPVAASAVAPSAAAPAAAATTPSAKSSTRYAIRYDQKSDRYCLRERGAVPTTGSRLVLERCKTRGDWAADGLTIAQR